MSYQCASALVSQPPFNREDVTRQAGRRFSSQTSSRHKMDTLTFIAKLVEFSAWPIASVAVILLLRKEIRRLLLLVRKLKAGPIEAEFEREVIELSESTKSLPAPPALPPSITLEKEALARLAKVNPRSAILEAWREVEASALRAVEQKNVSIPDRAIDSPAAAIRALAKENQLSEPPRESWRLFGLSHAAIAVA